MNQLNYIRDAVSSSCYPYEITDQSADNYLYDSIGNTLKDVGSDIIEIVWNPYGKVTQVKTNDANIYYLYDGLGRRVRKRVETGSGTPTTTWYILDAGGRNISTYTRTDEVEETQQELTLYGGSRLGLYRREVREWGTPYDKLNNPWPVYTRFINRKQYEITDHPWAERSRGLGSTRVIVNDRAITTFSEEDSSVTGACGERSRTTCADVLSLLNYYPGGQLQPGMTWENTLYRYGYNTQERSDEIYGPGNFYTAEFWEYDSRIWRRWNRDPVVKPHESSYAVLGNSPIWFVDYDGRDTLRMRLQQVFTNAQHLIIFKVGFSLIQNGVEKLVEAPMNLSGSNEIYFGFPRANFVGSNAIPKGIYDVSFRKGGSFSRSYSEEWNANTIFIQGVGRGQFIHPGAFYEGSAGCLIPGIFPVDETIRNVSGNPNTGTNGYINTSTEQNFGRDLVSKSMLNSIGLLYNSAKSLNSVEGNFGFQLTTREPVIIELMPRIKVTEIQK